MATAYQCDACGKFYKGMPSIVSGQADLQYEGKRWLVGGADIPRIHMVATTSPAALCESCTAQILERWVTCIHARLAKIYDERNANAPAEAANPSGQDDGAVSES